MLAINIFKEHIELDVEDALDYFNQIVENPYDSQIEVFFKSREKMNEWNRSALKELRIQMFDEQEINQELPNVQTGASRSIRHSQQENTFLLQDKAINYIKTRCLEILEFCRLLQEFKPNCNS